MTLPPSYLYVSKTKREQQLDSDLRRCVFDLDYKIKYQIERLEMISKYWAGKGCINSKQILKYGASESISSKEQFTKLSEYDRFSYLIMNKKKSVSCITTSGSSGSPLSYYISSNWRMVHRLLWRSAYQINSGNQLTGYLDPNFKWAMARPPGGKYENYTNIIECIPTHGKIIFSKDPRSFSAEIVHGSITTILEILENEYAQKWKPLFVFLTYEKAEQWQINLLARIWPQTKIHIEYASNDGSAAAFSCSNGRLHYWDIQSVAYAKSCELCLIDLWNYATCFIGYKNGDLVNFTADHKCSCGQIYPTLSITGRKSGSIRLSNGLSIHNLCPLNSSQMIGLRIIRIIIKSDLIVNVEFVRNQLEKLRIDLIAKELELYGFKKIEFKEFQSISELRRISSNKFQTVIDEREA